MRTNDALQGVYQLEGKIAPNERAFRRILTIFARIASWSY